MLTAFQYIGLNDSVISSSVVSAILNSIDSVILNLFQDNMMARTVMLKQVQHDGFGDKKIYAYYGGAQ